MFITERGWGEGHCGCGEGIWAGFSAVQTAWSCSQEVISDMQAVKDDREPTLQPHGWSIWDQPKPQLSFWPGLL